MDNFMNELEFVTLHRRHLHQYPELSLHEFETTSYITSFLEDLGVPYDRPLKTGVIAYLEGNSHHTIAFRADIDALPIYEDQSQNLFHCFEYQQIQNMKEQVVDHKN